MTESFNTTYCIEHDGTGVEGEVVILNSSAECF